MQYGAQESIRYTAGNVNSIVTEWSTKYLAYILRAISIVIYADLFSLNPSFFSKMEETAFFKTFRDYYDQDHFWDECMAVHYCLIL